MISSVAFLRKKKKNVAHSWRTFEKKKPQVHSILVHCVKNLLKRRDLLTKRKKFCLKITNEIANWKSLKTKTLVLRFVEAEFKSGSVVMRFSRENTYFSWILFGDIKNLKKLRNQKTF